MTFSPDPRKNPVAEPIVKKFRDKGIEPEGYVLYTYGAVQAFAQAAAKAGSVEAAKLVPVLRAEKFDTVLGTIGFDEKGDVTAPGYVFYEWKNGKYDYLQ
jgi:branched-chain amino acid transport system substrate-binding protein